MLAVTVLSLCIAIVIGVGLYIKASPILHEKSLFNLLGNSHWRPFKGEFGFYPFIMGTLWVTGIAILLSLPVSLLTAIYISEYADKRIRRAVNPMLDILSGIPSGCVRSMGCCGYCANGCGPHCSPFCGFFDWLQRFDRRDCAGNYDHTIADKYFR